MNASKALQLYNRFREEHNGVFLITRNCDAKMYLYIAKRAGNVLVDNKVDCSVVLAPNWHKQEKIPDVILDNFFALSVFPIAQTSKYTACMAAFPQRPMTLHLKKNSTEHKSDGSVNAMLTFWLSPTASVDNVQLLVMEQEMTFDELEIPDLTRVRLYGCVNVANVKHLSKHMIAEHCVPLSETQVLITEVLEVTDEMRKRFDVRTLARQWLLSKAKSKLA